MSRTVRIALFFFVSGLFYVPFVRDYGIQLVPENSDDFPSYYFGARLAFEERVSPYDARNWRGVPLEYAGDNSKFYPYLYPPPSLLLFRPSTSLDYATARLSMLVFNHLLVLAILALVLSRILQMQIVHPLSGAVVAFTLSFFPLMQTLEKGQTNLIILLLLVLVWIAFREGKASWLMALALAPAVVLKLTPALLLVPLWLRGRRAAVLWTLAILAALAGLSLALLPPGMWDSWFVEVGSKGYAQTIGNLSLSTPANQSLNALIDRTFYGRNVRFAPIIGSAPPWAARGSIYILAAAVLAITLLASYWSSRRAAPGSLDLELTVWLLAAFLVAPISWDHHLVLLLPCILVLLQHVLKRRWPLPAVAATVALGVFLALPYPSNSPAFREGLKTLLISMQLYAVCALWGLSLIALLRSSSPDLRKSATS